MDFRGNDIMVDVDGETLARRVLETIPLIMRLIHKDLRRLEHHMEPNQYQILGMLMKGSLTVSDLAQRQRVSLPSMSKTVNSLVERGLVLRLDDPGDRRVVQLQITQPGRSALGEIPALLVPSLVEALSRLDAGERDTLSAGLDVLHRAFCDAPAKPPCP